MPEKSARDFLNLEKVVAACEARGVDPHEIIAEAFTPASIEAMGQAVVTKFAIDMVMKAEGQTVNINGSLTAPVEHDPVSKTVDWAAEVTGKGKKRKKSGPRKG